LLPQLLTSFMWAFEVPVGAATGTPPVCEWGQPGYRCCIPCVCPAKRCWLAGQAVLSRVCSTVIQSPLLAVLRRCGATLEPVCFLSSPTPSLCVFAMHPCSLPRPRPAPAHVCCRAKEPLRVHRQGAHLFAGTYKRWQCAGGPSREDRRHRARRWRAGRSIGGPRWGERGGTLLASILVCQGLTCVGAARRRGWLASGLTGVLCL
jgi:hypothetical protein